MTATKKTLLWEKARKLVLPLVLLAFLFYQLKGLDDATMVYVYLGAMVGFVAMDILSKVSNLVVTLVTREKPELPGSELGKLEIDRL